MTSLFWEGFSPKETKSDRGEGGVSQKVMILNKSDYIALHNRVIEEEGGVSQKVTKSDRGRGVSALLSKPKVTSFLYSPYVCIADFLWQITFKMRGR